LKAKDLAARLLQNPEMEIMVLDGSNGGGVPRTINFGPVVSKVNKSDEYETADCEGKVGQSVLIIGFGSY
jgi:hypothetical protein